MLHDPVEPGLVPFAQQLPECRAVEDILHLVEE
jgi:hypothetical protein